MPPRALPPLGSRPVNMERILCPAFLLVTFWRGFFLPSWSHQIPLQPTLTVPVPRDQYTWPRPPDVLTRKSSFSARALPGRRQGPVEPGGGRKSERYRVVPGWWAGGTCLESSRARCPLGWRGPVCVQLPAGPLLLLPAGVCLGASVVKTWVVLKLLCKLECLNVSLWVPFSG